MNGGVNEPNTAEPPALMAILYKTQRQASIRKPTDMPSRILPFCPDLGPAQTPAAVRSSHTARQSTATQSSACLRTPVPLVFSSMCLPKASTVSPLWHSAL